MASQLNKLAQFVQQNPLAVTQFGAGLLSQPTIGQGVQAGLLGAMQAKQWSDQREEKKKREEAQKALFNRFPQANGPIQDLGGGVTSQDLPGPLQANQPNQYGMTEQDKLYYDLVGPQYLAAKLSQGSAERKYAKSADNRLRYLDNGELVFPDVVKDKGAEPLPTINNMYNTSNGASAQGKLTPNGYEVLTPGGWVPAGPEWVEGPLYRPEGEPSGGPKQKLDARLPAMQNFARRGSELLTAIKDNPDAFTFGGTVSRIAGGVIADAKATLRLAGENDSLATIDTYDAKWRQLGITNATTKTQMLGLALMTAQADNEGSLKNVSDKEMKNYIDMIGGVYGNPETRYSSLREFMTGRIKDYENEYQNVYGKPFDQNYDWGLPPALNGPIQPNSYAEPQTDDEYNALPSGALFKDPDSGEILRKP